MSTPIDQTLARRLAAEPETPLAMMVEFSRPPDRDDPALPLLAWMGPTLAGGTLTPAEIITLGDRDDVSRSEAVPENYPN
ncbi:MAG: hypothetical protein ABWY56_12160 [Propionibacteriaceae bacterium]